MPSAAQPTAGQKGVARSPKCQGRGRRTNDANSSATATSEPSSSSVPTMIAAGDSPGSSTPSAAHAMPAVISPVTAPARNPTGPYHHGQRGRASSGSSGGSGGADTARPLGGRG